MYRIAWKSKISDSSGSGNFCLTEEEAKEQVESMTKDFPLSTFWYEADIPAPLNLKGHRCSYGDMTFIEDASPSPKVERPPPLNLKFHICSYGDSTLVAYLSPPTSPVVKPQSPNVNQVIPRVAKIKKTCSFGDVTIHEFPNLSPHYATPMASPVASPVA